MNEMDVEIRNILVGILDFEPIGCFVDRQQVVSSVPVFQNAIAIGLLIVVLAPIFECLVEEIHPFLAQFDSFVVRFVDGGHLILGFETSIGQQTCSHILVAEWTRIDPHNQFGNWFVGFETCHKIDIVVCNLDNVFIREWLLLDEFLVVKGHVHVDASKAKDEPFQIWIGTTPNLFGGSQNLGAIVVALPTESLGAGGLVFLNLNGVGSFEYRIGIVVQQAKQFNERVPKKDGLDVLQFVVGMAIVVVEPAIIIVVVVVLLEARRRMVAGFDCGTIHVGPSAFAVARRIASSSAITVAVLVVVSLAAVAAIVVVAALQVSPTAALAGTRASISVVVVAASPTTSQMGRYVSSWHCTRSQ